MTINLTTIMKHSTTLRMGTAWLIACLVVLFTAGTSPAQLRPDLGTASTYAIFTGGGAINVTVGDTAVLTGDVGQDGAYAFNGFPPSTYTGALNRNNAASAQAKADLITAQTADGLVPCGTVLGVGIVDGQSFDPGVYCSGAATTTTGNITFNAHGNASAIFIVKIGGQLDANAGTHILLANNARAANIYWFVDGAVNVANGSSFAGTIIANGSITFLGNSSLNGRALVAPAGAINLASNHMSISTDSGSAANNLTVVKPARGDSILRGTLNDTIRWTGSGITRSKTLQYSLDSGRTWTTIATITTDSFDYVWHVPDTTSTKAFVRVTDTNNLRGVSGVFKIISNKIHVITPAAGTSITGGALHDTITWTGTGLNHIKTFAYSLDSGLTWTTIGKDTTNGFTYLWNVPDTTSTKAMIRITDSNGVTGNSGVFTIRSNQITVMTPTPGQMIPEGTQNFQITWSGTGITPQKTLELSLDGGHTWTTIGTITANVFNYFWNVPDTTSSLAIIRITDTNGMTGQSAMFSISSNKSLVVVRPSAGEVIAEGLQNYQITWTGVGLTGQKTIELSLDGGNTWSTIGSVTANVFTYSWNVPNTPSTQAIIRITDGEGTRGQSGIFTIKPNAGSIVIIDPEVGENVDGGTVNYLINFTATNTTAQKTLEYSLDGGLTWTLIGVMNSEAQSYTWALVPNVATTRALVRIEDANGVTGISGLFTITTIPGKGSMNSLTLSGLDSNGNIGNNKLLGITWTFTKPIGNSVKVEYSLDYTKTWQPIATVPVTESPNSTAWITTASGYYNPVFIRVTSSGGDSLTSIPFSIGSAPAAVSANAVGNGLAISNYPNPASEQTTINFELPVRSDVTLVVCDNLGRTVNEVTGTFDAGTHTLPVNTSQLANGIYTYSLVAGSTRVNGRMNVVR